MAALVLALAALALVPVCAADTVKPLTFEEVFKAPLDLSLIHI